MNRTLLAASVVLLAATALKAQPPSDLHSRPELPPPEVLERLNLNIAWSLHVPMDGRRDGFFSIQFVDSQILIQTRSGLLVALDRDTGRTQWRVRVGRPYPAGQQAAAFNASSFIVARDSSLFSLDRSNGQVQWQLELPYTLSTSPVAVDQRLYTCSATDKLYVYALPRYAPFVPAGEKERLPAPGATAGSGPLKPAQQEPTRAGATEFPIDRPVLLWDQRIYAHIDQPLVMIAQLVFAVDSNGSFFALAKSDKSEVYRFPLEVPLAAPVAQHEGIAYVGARDNTLIALDLATNRLLWRLVTGTPITQKPVVIDEDVYVVTEGSGLYRVDRASGREVWRQPNRNAARFLGANPKFVYALDRSGRMLVLDRARGTQLSVYNVRDFVFPVTNELTDRFFLASNDGRLVCIHDRDYTTPVRLKTLEPPAKPKPAPGAKPEAKPKAEGAEKMEKP